MKFSYFFQALVVLLSLFVGGTNEASAQTIVRAYSTWAAGSWDSGSWQVLGRQGNVVAMLPQGYYGRWANVPVRGVYEVQRQTGETVWISEDSAGNRQVFREDPIANARAQAISLDAQAEYAREMAEIDQWQKKKQIGNLRRADRLLASGVHKRATEAYTAEVDSGVYSGAAAIRDGFGVAETAHEPQQPNANWRSRQGAPAPQPAAPATQPRPTTPSRSARADSMQRAYQTLLALRRPDSVDKEIFWARVDSYVEEASMLGTLYADSCALERLLNIWVKVRPDLANPEWQQSDVPGLVWVYTARAAETATSPSDFNRAIMRLESLEAQLTQGGHPVDWTDPIDWLRRSQRDWNAGRP